jgi:hypothetical protein
MKRNSRRRQDFLNNPNAQKRMEAGKRSDTDHAGGIVAEAEQEQEQAAALETPEEIGDKETPVEPTETEASETPEEEATEPAAEEASETPETEAEAAEQEAPMEEAPETPEEEAAEPAAEEASETPETEAAEQEAPEEEYTAPEGESHKELVSKYHEALILGDVDLADDLYHQLSEHRRRENLHRNKQDATAKADEDEYVRVATELASKHPELGEDGLESDKVLALADTYRNHGLSAAEALQKAVSDLYPEEAAESEAPKASIAVEIGKGEPAKEAQETPATEEEPAPATAEEPTPEVEKPSLIPDQSERLQQKRNTPALDVASARNLPEPPPKEPTRTDAIAQIKARRGQ